VGSFFKVKKLSSWQSLYNESSVVPEVSEDIEDTFDSMFTLIAGTGENLTACVSFFLRYCLGWKPEQISSVVSRKPHTVSNNLWKIKCKLQATGYRNQISMDTANLNSFKYTLAIVLSRAGLNPPAGTEFRRRDLLLESKFLLQKLHLNDPKKTDFLVRLLAVCCLLRMTAQYKSDRDPNLPEDQWQRELWDDTLIEDIKKHFNNLIALNPEEGIKQEAKFYFELYIPGENNEVKWKVLSDLAQEWMNSDPSGNSFLTFAMCLSMAEGPSRAANYLEGIRLSPFFRNNSLPLTRLAYYCSLAGQKSKARHFYKLALKFPLPERMTRVIKVRINELKND